MGTRVLTVAGLIGSVGLFAALCRRRQHFHAIYSGAQSGERYGVPAKVSHGNPPGLGATHSIFVLDDRGKGDAAHARNEPEYGHFVEHDDGSRSGTLQFDSRQLGLVGHQYSSIGSVGTADVARSQAAAPGSRLSVAIARAA